MRSMKIRKISGQERRQGEEEEGQLAVKSSLSIKHRFCEEKPIVLFRNLTLPAKDRAASKSSTGIASSTFYGQASTSNTYQSTPFAV